MINLIVFIPIIAAFLIGFFGSGKKIAFGAASLNLVLGILFLLNCSAKVEKKSFTKHH